MAAKPRRAGADSEFFALEEQLKDLGARAAHEPLAAWLERIEPLVDRSIAERLASALRLHYRYRFDPRGLDAEERRALRELCRGVSARLESSHG